MEEIEKCPECGNGFLGHIEYRGLYDGWTEAYCQGPRDCSSVRIGRWSHEILEDGIHEDPRNRFGNWIGFLRDMGHGNFVSIPNEHETTPVIFKIY